jgi:hypothetical protein
MRYAETGGDSQQLVCLMAEVRYRRHKDGFAASRAAALSNVNADVSVDGIDRRNKPEHESDRPHKSVRAPINARRLPVSDADRRRCHCHCPKIHSARRSNPSSSITYAIVPN